MNNNNNIEWDHNNDDIPLMDIGRNDTTGNGDAEIIKIENILLITQMSVFVIGILTALVIVISYLKRLSDNGNKALNVIKNDGENAAKFVVSIGDMVANSINNALGETIELLTDSGNQVIAGAKPITDSITEMNDTINEGVGEMNNELGVKKTESGNKVNKLVYAINSMVPGISLGVLDELTEEIEEITEGPDPDDTGPEDEEASKYNGRWIVNGSSPPQYFNIVHIGDMNYKFYYNPAYVADTNPIDMDPIGFYEIIKQSDGMFGTLSMAWAGYEDSYFVLSIDETDETSMDWIMFGRDMNTNEWIYDPTTTPVAILTREGEVQWTPDGLTMIF